MYTKDGLNEKGSTVAGFELFRLSLLQRQIDLIDGVEFKDFTREDWLRYVFLSEQPFEHYKSNFHYAPSREYSEDDLIIGRVGRNILRDENLPPDEGLEDVTRETWIASVLLLDPTHHDDGQKLAIQHITDVGKPAALVKEIVSAVNARYRYGPYHIEASQIVEASTFWDFVSENRSTLTSVSFEFITPNMFGGYDEFDSEMREFRDNEKAQRVKLSIQSDDHIDAETERMKTAVDYAARGGGKISAKAGKGKSYNSKDEVKRTYLEDVKEKGVELVKVAKEFANRILGRE